MRIHDVHHEFMDAIVGWRFIGNHMMSRDDHIVSMSIGDIDSACRAWLKWHDAGRVFFVSHIMNVLRHGWSWFDDTPLIGHGQRIMNRFIEPPDERVLPDVDRDSFHVMVDANTNVCMMGGLQSMR